MLRWALPSVLVLSAALAGCQPVAPSPSARAPERTEKETTKATEPSGIKPPNPDPGK